MAARSQCGSFPSRRHQRARAPCAHTRGALHGRTPASHLPQGQPLQQERQHSVTVCTAKQYLRRPGTGRCAVQWHQSTTLHYTPAPVAAKHRATLHTSPTTYTAAQQQARWLQGFEPRPKRASTLKELPGRNPSHKGRKQHLGTPACCPLQLPATRGLPHAGAHRASRSACTAAP